jgi:uncharacterized protein DUF4376
MFNIANNYWIVGDDAANVWSSAAAASVPIADPNYVEWQAGNHPSQIASMEELEAVFAQHYPPGSLKTYAAFRRWQKEQAGITLASGMPIETDDRAQAKISGAYFAAQEVPTVVTPWHAADGVVYPLDSAAIIAMNNELLTHINNCFSISADVLAGIADGTITTREQIDAAFDAPITQARKDWLKKVG